MAAVQYVAARSKEELQQIVALQQSNLPDIVACNEHGSQGFVTVVHTTALLQRMNQPYPHILAKVATLVIGYALIMLKEFQNDIPVLVPMFRAIDGLSYQGKALATADYFVMGQVCVSREFRGQGVFRGLYQALKQQMQPHFPFVITEVALRNTRSLEAHHRIGFQPLHLYSAFGEEWEIMLWDWQ